MNCEESLSWRYDWQSHVHVPLPLFFRLVPVFRRRPSLESLGLSRRRPLRRRPDDGVGRRRGGVLWLPVDAAFCWPTLGVSIRWISLVLRPAVDVGLRRPCCCWCCSKRCHGDGIIPFLITVTSARTASIYHSLALLGALPVSPST